MVSYVRWRPTDAPLLAEIGGITLLQSHGHSAPPGVMQAYVNRSFSEAACRAELSDEKNIFMAVLYNGRPAGYFKIMLAMPHPLVPLQPVTKLERLYLLQEFHGLKLGHGLLQEALAISRSGGDKGMWLDVWQKNEQALRFYKRQGFDIVGEGRFVLTDTRTNPIWIMLLRYANLP